MTSVIEENNLNDSIQKNELLKVKNLNAYFGTTQALRDVNIEVYKGEILSLIGPSGCGKSTFLRCINRLHEEVPGASISGEITLNGESLYGIGRDPVKVRRSIGMVFQKPNPFPLMSIYENVSIGLKLSGISKRTLLDDLVEEALKKAALWEEVRDVLKREGTSLSGGQQQRLCMARALALKPPILLMDEPTSALDPISTGKIEELLQSLKKTTTILIVTHNMQQASRISDRTAFFLTGQLIECGKTKNIFTNPKNRQTEDYITGRFG